MTAILDMTRDNNGYCAYGVPLNNMDAPGGVNSYSTTLSAGVPQSLTIPASNSIWAAVFSFEPGSAVWVANNDTATAPSGSFAATSSQLNPSVRQVNGGDILSFITSDTTAQIGVSLYVVVGS